MQVLRHRDSPGKLRFRASGTPNRNHTSEISFKKGQGEAHPVEQDDGIVSGEPLEESIELDSGEELLHSGDSDDNGEIERLLDRISNEDQHTDNGGEQRPGDPGVNGEAQDQDAGGRAMR